MIEFMAGFAVGGLIFFVVGLVVSDILRHRWQQETPEQTPQAQRPAALPEPQTQMYQPPIIVLAAPRERSTSLARR